MDDTQSWITAGSLLAIAVVAVLRFLGIPR